MPGTYYIGVDEAGYGPNLGPLVVSSTSFVASRELPSHDWWSFLSPVVGRAGSGAPVIIDDSKRVLGMTRGHEALACAVERLLTSCGQWSSDWIETFASIAPRDVDQWRDEHWFDSGEQAATSSSNGSLSGDWEECLKSAGLLLQRVCARCSFPRDFNGRLTRHATKADVEAELIASILEEQLEQVPTSCDAVDVTIDRLGGRRYYRMFVEGFAQDSLVMTEAESADESVYRFVRDGRAVVIRFVVKGDQRSFAVAAASMTAKYIREEAMRGLNAYWMAEIPGLLPTAGYPVDAKRFRIDIGPAFKKKKIADHDFWRQK